MNIHNAELSTYSSLNGRNMILKVYIIFALPKTLSLILSTVEKYFLTMNDAKQLSLYLTQEESK